MENNVDNMARHYVETLNSPANAWGQHHSPIYGQSHNILRRMTLLFGQETTNRAIDKAIGKPRIDSTTQTR